MPVEAEDGPVGSIASIPRVDLDDATSQSDVIVLANEENAGPGVEEFLRVPRTMVERVDRGVLYLNVPRRSVPRASAAVAATHRLDQAGSKITIPVSEEVVEVTPRVVELGHLHIQKKTDEYLDEQTVRLSQHEVQVERVPIDEIIDQPIEPYMDGDVYVVPVIEEEVVIQRRLRLKEELRVHRTVVERDETIQTPFRRERVVVNEHRYDNREDEPVEH
jgi:stress response protein YsnF